MHPVEEVVIGRAPTELLLELLNRIFLGELELEFLLELFMNITIADMGYICIAHQRYQIEDEIRAFSKDRIGHKTEALETSELRGLHPTHCLDHLGAHFDRRRERLGVTAQNITEID